MTSQRWNLSDEGHGQGHREAIERKVRLNILILTSRTVHGTLDGANIDERQFCIPESLEFFK